jgi:hypothetical protein
MVELAATMAVANPRLRSPMNRLVTSTAPLLLAALLPACSTLVGHFVNTNVEEMTMDGAQVTFHEPAHCGEPGYDVKFHPGPGIVMTITSESSGGLGLSWFEMQVEPGRSFAFASTTGRIESHDGTGADMTVSNVQGMRDSHSVRLPMPADGVMAGNSAAGDVSHYSGDFDSHHFNPTAFTLQLPGAVVNGKPYRFPPIRYSARPLTYFQDACLR